MAAAFRWDPPGFRRLAKTAETALGKSVLTLRIVASLAGLALLAAAAPARADEESSAAVEKITKLNKKAVDEFENLNFDQARKILKTALDACASAGLDSSQVAARTHVHLGVVLFAGFKQKDDALAEFKKALEMAPDVKLDKLLATPEIQEVFDQAVAEQKRAGSGGETTTPSTDAITHEPVTAAAQGKPIQISATLDSSVKAKKVVLSFSADGSEDFGEREMKEESPGNWMGEIPASATEGAKVSYYIEVDGDGDQVLATKGSAAAPLVVALRGGVGVKPKAPPPPPKEKESEGPTWYFALGLGSGFGWTTGQGEINKGNAMSPQRIRSPGDQVKPGGFAWARLGQIAPEVGYFLSPDLMVSVQLRLQFVTGATPFYAVPTDTTTCGASMLCAAPSLAVAGFARAHYLFHFDDLHPFVAGMVGGGTIRHVATFNSRPRCGLDMHTTCVDTIAAGPVFVGGGGGIFYNLSPSVRADRRGRHGRRLHQLHAELRPQRRHRGGVLAGFRDLGREQVGEGVDRELGVDAQAGREDRAVGDPEIFELMVAAARVDHRPSRIFAHRRAPHLVRGEHGVEVGAERRRGDGAEVGLAADEERRLMQGQHLARAGGQLQPRHVGDGGDGRLAQ